MTRIAWSKGVFRYTVACHHIGVTGYSGNATINTRYTNTRSLNHLITRSLDHLKTLDLFIFFDTLFYSLIPLNLNSPQKRVDQIRVNEGR